MPTTKKRMNMSLPPEIEAAIDALADRDHMTPTSKALHLIKRALEIEEDDVWNDIAASRDTADAKFVSHEQAWS